MLLNVFLAQTTVVWYSMNCSQTYYDCYKGPRNWCFNESSQIILMLFHQASSSMVLKAWSSDEQNENPGALVRNADSQATPRSSDSDSLGGGAQQSGLEISSSRRS